METKKTTRNTKALVRNESFKDLLFLCTWNYHIPLWIQNDEKIYNLIKHKKNWWIEWGGYTP